MLYALLYSATPSICFTLLGHAFSPCINPHYYFTPAWTPVDMLCQSFVWYLLHSITEPFWRLVPWCSAHYHNTVSDPFTFNLSTHTDTQFTPRLRPCLCFESLRWKNQFVVSSIYQVSPHHNGVDGVVNDDNPRGRIPDTAPTEPCCDLPTLLMVQSHQCWQPLHLWFQCWCCDKAYFQASLSYVSSFSTSAAFWLSSETGNGSKKQVLMSGRNKGWLMWVSCCCSATALASSFLNSLEPGQPCWSQARPSPVLSQLPFHVYMVIPSP